jgi:protein-S-isoprenylcysteine O-methyltransferase Ste14
VGAVTELLTRPEFIWSWMGLACVVLVLLLFISAPYGRHARAGWGPMFQARLSWVVMELPALMLPVGCFIYAGRWDDVVGLVCLTLWVTHYGYRALIYPSLSKVPGKPVPISVTLLGAGFSTINGALQGAFLFLGPLPHTTAWLSDGRFGLGLLLFGLGFVIHCRSDAILRGLRRSPDAGYRIPQGFLFRWVSAPNYLGEMLQWLGWAVLTWSLAGSSFAVWTVANLLPRSLSNHRWYRQTFEDYPSGRKAVLPFIL